LLEVIGKSQGIEEARFSDSFFFEIVLVITDVCSCPVPLTRQPQVTAGQNPHSIIEQTVAFGMVD